MNRFNKLMVIAVAALVAVGVARTYAKTGTNVGRTYTQSLMSEMTASTAAQNATRYAQRVGEQGLLVAQYDTSLGTNGTINLVGCTVPKGAILLENAVVEVTTAVLPSTSTNAIAAASQAVVATGITLGSTGIKAAVSTPVVTTAAGSVVLTVTGDAITSGVFTVYIPYIQGVAWE